MSLTDIDPQFRLDSEVAPTYVVKDYDIDTGEFSVFYNDGTLAEDDWYDACLGAVLGRVP